MRGRLYSSTWISGDGDTVKSPPDSFEIWNYLGVTQFRNFLVS
jgi:hypothetical protein